MQRSGATRRRLAALVLTAAVMAIPATAARAVGGSWGPQRIPFRNGVLCDLGRRTAALVSWPAAGSNAPAFALRTVTGPSTGLPGRFDTPAVDGTAAPYSSSGALSTAALAYLIGAHGAAASGTTVGEVAALAAGDAVADACVASGDGDLDTGAIAALASQAQSHAGPYRVQVASSAPKLVPGSDAEIDAAVHSAEGAAVAGMRVTFSTADGEFASGLTNADGLATATLRVPAASSTTSVALRASISAPVGLVSLTAPRRVSLVTTAAPQTFDATTTVPIDTTADPVLRVSTAAPLALAGDSVATTVDVSGMRGHSGFGRVQAFGPLAFAPGAGCAQHHRDDYATAHATTIGHPVDVVGDKPFAATIGPIDKAGCYLVRAELATTNAQPAVSAHSDGTVLAVAPVKITVDAANHGVAGAGPLHASIEVSGDSPATLQDVSGTVVGPRPASLGTCPATNWASAARAATVSAGANDAGSVAITTGSVSQDGCYALRLSAAVSIEGVGVTASRPLPVATALVLAPSVAVTTLRSPSVPVGHAATATVQVLGTLTQHGALQLRLAKLPHPEEGCFGRSYDELEALPLPAKAPTTASVGDGTYTVTSPPVPDQGCWTVEPVLTISADPALRTVGTPTLGSNVAFTAVAPLPSRAIGGSATDTSDSTRIIAAGIVAALLLIGALIVTLVLARRSERAAEAD